MESMSAGKNTKMLYVLFCIIIKDTMIYLTLNSGVNVKQIAQKQQQRELQVECTCFCDCYSSTDVIEKTVVNSPARLGVTT